MNKLKSLPHTNKYLSKVFKSFLLALSILVFSLLIGTVGYCYFFDISFIDGFLNASMILTGMGPVTPAITTGSKVFASIYAIYSGVAFLTSVGVLFAPVVHRFLHKFHIDVHE
jgi:hypothetical protein